MDCKLANITVHYELFGEGRPIIMLHGWPLDHRHMVGDMEPIFERRDGCKRIYPDLPGMGKTPGADWITHQDQILDIVLEFMDHVIPGERFAVAGMSYGGYLARGVVFRRPTLLDGILMIVPVIQAETEKRALPTHVILAVDSTLISELGPDEAAEFQEIAVVQNRTVLDALRTDIYPGVESADHEFLSRLRENYAFSFDVDALPEPFAGPALILMGRQDAVCGYEDAWEILENYPRGTFAVLDRAGHCLSYEQVDLFRALVNEWLDRVEETTA